MPAVSNLTDRSYWAFISYSSKDRKWGEWLHRRLENYPIPPEFRSLEVFDGAVLGKNLRPVFRDRDELAGSANLGEAIHVALEASRFLVVLCSKNSAKSQWVNTEIEDFQALGKGGRILALILDGEPNATNKGFPDDECFPPALRYPAEPIAGDLRKEGDGKARGFLKILAGIAQLDFDKLYRRHERAQARKRLIAGAVALTLIAAFAGLSVFAWSQQQEAEKNARQAKDNARTANAHLAEANWIVGQSVRGTAFYPHRESVIEAAHYLLKSAEAAQMAGNEDESRAACLAAVFAASPLRATLVHDEAVDGVDYSPDQHRILAWNRGGTLWVWDMTNGIPVGRPGVLRAEGEITRAWFDTNGRQIIALLSVPSPKSWCRADSSAQWWDIATRVSTRFPLSPPAQVIGVSPDGSRVLTQTQTNTVQWWNAAGDRALGPAITFTRPFWQAGFVGDEILFALADNGLELYHAKQNPTHRFLPEAWFNNENGLKNALLSADGRRVLLRSFRTFSLPRTEASGRAKNRPLDYSGGGRLVDALTSERMRGPASVGYRGVAWLFDTETGRQIAEHDHQSQAVCEFSPDGRHFVMASAQETVMFYSTHDGQSLGQPMNHEGLRGAAFSPNGQLALTWSDDSLQAWEVPSGQPVGQPIKETGRISNARFSPDGHQVLTWGDGNTVRIWLLGAPYQVGRPMPHETLSEKARFTSDGRSVLTEGRDSLWYVWDAVDGKLMSSKSFSLDKDNGVWSPDGQRVLCWRHNESAATLYNVRDGIPVGEPIIVKVNEAVGGAVFSPDGSQLLVWSTGGVVAGGVVARLVDGETGMSVGEPLMVEQGFGPPSVQFSPDGKLFLTWGKSAQLWQARLGLPTGSPMSHRHGITGVKFSEDGQRLATWNNEREAEVCLWSVPTGQALAKPLLHSNSVIDVTFNRDGQRVLTSNSDDHIRLWNTASGEFLGQPIPHDRHAPLVFAPDGERFLTVSGGSVLQWNSSDGSPTAFPIKHEGASGATFSGDRLWIVTWGAATARLWCASNGQCIAIFHHAWNVTGATFNRSQRRLLTTSEDGTAWLWDLSLDERVAIDERVLEFEIRSGTKLDPIGGVRQISFSEWERKKSQFPETRHR